MSKLRLSRVVAGLALASAALLGACVHQVVSSGTNGNGAAAGLAPQLAVESFLRAANCVASASCTSKARDLDTMTHLFGTRDGSILERDSRADVEKRMYALASLLQSEDYQVQGQNIVPGRVGEAVQLLVRLKQNGRAISLPITMVHAHGGDWLVEQIDMGPLTQRP